MSVASPCIKVCQLDAASGLCAGCHRTAKEIELWLSASDQEKRVILQAVAQRASALGTQPGTQPLKPSQP